MEKRIYTIPVTEAFSQDCECPMCILEKDLEERYLNNILGHSIMDIHTRAETNMYGFCRIHYRMMYAKQFSRLQLGLLLDTYMHDRNVRFGNLYERIARKAKGKDLSFLWKLIKGKDDKNEVGLAEGLGKLLSMLKEQEKYCTICRRMEHFMYRYIDVILLLWWREEEFRTLFKCKKGFCMKHFRMLLEVSIKYLSRKNTAELVNVLLSMQMEQLNTLEEDVHWFTQKFAFHNKDAPWGNSKDALIRGIQRVVGYCELK